jgi:hypothetical protein
MLAHWHIIDINISQSECQLLLTVHHWHANGEWFMVYTIGISMVNDLHHWYANDEWLT